MERAQNRTMQDRKGGGTEGQRGAGKREGKGLQVFLKERAGMQNSLLAGLQIIAVVSYLFNGLLSSVFHIFICSIQR